MKGLLGQKVGMSSVFASDGKNIPVSIIEVEPNIVTSVISANKHGYVATQLAAFDKREKLSTKPEMGHLKLSKSKPKYFVKEIKHMEGYEVSSKLDVTLFKAGEFVDITGVSKGKGFQGSIKRHNQKIGPKSHGGGGGSKPVRLTGSLGDLVSNRVFKGMTMPGHMGAKKVTTQNLEIIDINVENNFLLVKGSIPGPRKGYLVIKKAVKNSKEESPKEIVNMKKEEQKLDISEKVVKSQEKIVKSSENNKQNLANTTSSESKKNSKESKA